MSPPDSSREPSSWNGQPLTDDSSAFSTDNYSDVAQLAKTLSELGGGAVALDLALDLVLNEVVEQARLATGATGAAVALVRDGEMVCRAMTGEHAPELGVRVETESGLSAECLRTGQLQYCSDSETDPRVDAKACRQLGIRSVMLLPLGDGMGAFGILEAFSSRPNAFGERDANTLRALAGRVSASRRAAQEGSAGSSNNSLVTAPIVDEAENDVEASDHAQNEPDRLEHPAHAGSGQAQEKASIDNHSLLDADALPYLEEPKGSDIWTTVLVILVIAAAISLGVVIGWRGALQGSVQAPPQHESLRPSTSSAPSMAASKSSAPPVESAAAANPVSARDTTEAKANSLSQTKHGNVANASAAPAGGGLTVTENGKVIYRAPSQPIPGAAGSTRAANEPPGTRLIHRVEPAYPEEARKRNIQGPVVLDVQVLGDGKVGNIEIAAGNPVLAEAAVHAVRQWKYQPYVVDGRPVQSQTRITIRFTLPSS